VLWEGTALTTAKRTFGRVSMKPGDNGTVGDEPQRPESSDRTPRAINICVEKTGRCNDARGQSKNQQRGMEDYRKCNSPAHHLTGRFALNHTHFDRGFPGSGGVITGRS
jgi:hypothetical protein